MTEEEIRDAMLTRAVKCERCKSKPWGQVISVHRWFGVWCSNTKCKGHTAAIDLRTSDQAVARWNGEQARIARGEVA